MTPYLIWTGYWYISVSWHNIFLILKLDAGKKGFYTFEIKHTNFGLNESVFDG